MNKQECDILYLLLNKPYISQRNLSEQTGYSIGLVNKTIKNLKIFGYLNEKNNITKKAIHEFEDKSPKNAIILAAGFGMRMVPINNISPKALLRVKGEILIERIIRQLHEVGIVNITIIVGFMKEKFDYLIDLFNVKIIINEDYSNKNNLHSLSLAANLLSNTYVIPSDVWFKHNPFQKYEIYSWYMIFDTNSEKSTIRVNRKMDLITTKKNQLGNGMIGLSYLTKQDSKIVKKKLLQLNHKNNDNLFWEEALYIKNQMIPKAKIVNEYDVHEINTYEQLRELDIESDHLKSDTIDLICDTLHASKTQIVDIKVLKKGMTNRSFSFQFNEKKYIMRIPGEGTSTLINRDEEKKVYDKISTFDISDKVLYFNAKSGYKLTEYIPYSRNCDPKNMYDVKLCMQFLKKFHSLNLKVEHFFDLFEKIHFYESLWNENESLYKDYKQVKTNVLKLKSYINKVKKEIKLTHIDAVPDNFLIYSENGEQFIKLIDWEYAAMQDPHIDIAMFAIYSLYDRKQIDELINIYFENQCEIETRIKIYCYISCCGLLWSNWCEYKFFLGIEFGEYSIKQYRYAKEYYQIATNEIERMEKLKCIQ